MNIKHKEVYRDKCCHCHYAPVMSQPATPPPPHIQHNCIPHSTPSLTESNSFEPPPLPSWQLRSAGEATVSQSFECDTCTATTLSVMRLLSAANSTCVRLQPRLDRSALGRRPSLSTCFIKVQEASLVKLWRQTELD